MDEQKKNEDLYWQINRITGECNYWKDQAGKYRHANHNNLKRIKVMRIYSIAVTLLLLISAVMLITL